ncbi:MAG: hypothetical protein ACFE9X_07835 [Promethearchaeota archaeon]
MNLKSIKTLLKKIKNPLTFRNALLYKFCSFLYRKNNGFYIFNESWDNLIILDACRYDVFKEQYLKRNMKGELFKKVSRGAHTISFLFENFTKNYYDDIIYITANPYVNKFLKGKFYKIISVWKDNWDEKHHTVLPETMYDYAIKTLLKYPNKKYIIHFMQPHFPYIGYKLEKNIPNKSFFSLYAAEIYTHIEYYTHIKIYKKNLQIALTYIEKLINVLPGITIVSADHGEAFKEKLHTLIPFTFSGHRRGIRMPSLVNVPWLIIRPEEKDHSIRNNLLEEFIISDQVNKLKNKKVI